jgi:hypothetical protein
MPNAMSRREFSTVAAFMAAGFAASASAQPKDPKDGGKIPPDKAGEWHGRFLEDARRLLKDRSALSAEGMNAQIDDLLKEELISKADADALRAIAGVLADPKADADAVEKVIRSTDERKTGSVAKAITSIASNSVAWVKKQLRKVDGRKLRLVVAHDVSGALHGAGAGAALGASIAGIGAIPGAVFGAIVGSSTTSLIAMEEK